MIESNLQQVKLRRGKSLNLILNILNNATNTLKLHWNCLDYNYYDKFEAKRTDQQRGIILSMQTTKEYNMSVRAKPKGAEEERFPLRFGVTFTDMHTGSLVYRQSDTINVIVISTFAAIITGSLIGAVLGTIASNYKCIAQLVILSTALTTKDWMTALVSVIGLFITSLLFGVLGVYLGVIASSKYLPFSVDSQVAGVVIGAISGVTGGVAIKNLYEHAIPGAGGS